MATLIASRGAKRKSLSTSGAIAAWIVGFFSIGCGKFINFRQLSFFIRSLGY